MGAWAAAAAITLALVIVLSFARSYTSLVLAYGFLDLAAQFAKRLVFVYPDQSSASQYLVLVVPKLLICGWAPRCRLFWCSSSSGTRQRRKRALLRTSAG